MKRAHLLFLLIALVQLAVPAWMIAKHERVLARGEAFRFRTAPVDPADPFRGEYVRLDFDLERETFLFPDADPNWIERDAFALLGTDDDGFATIAAFSFEEPGTGPYLKCKVRSSDSYYAPREGDQVRVELPFDRYYLREGDGPRTEEILADDREVDEERMELPTHAVVRVYQGGAVIEDLVIDGRTLRDRLNEDAGSN